MSKLKYYYQQLAECERLRKEIEWLEADPDLKRDMDFKNELETLIEQHNKTPREVYNLLAGDVSASESKHAPSVSLVVQLAISPEFNQSGAAWEHSCHAIPKNVKPQC